jgi:hypothetical protein
MRSVIIILLILLIGGGAYFGYTRYRRAQLLNSGENVLLINEREGRYTFTDYVEREEITSSYKVVDLVSNLSEEDLNNLTQGLDLFGTVPPFKHADVVVPLPEGEALKSWNALRETMTAQVQELCRSIEAGDLSNQCYMRHAIKMILENNLGAQECQKLFPDNFIEECENMHTTEQRSSIGDNDGNSLIDIYEFYADPLAAEANP